MPQAGLCEWLAALFREVLMDDDLALRPELHLRDMPGWDSIKHIELIVAVEAEFGIRFRNRDLETLHTVGELVQAISEKTASGGTKS